MKGIGLVGAHTALVEAGYQTHPIAGTSAGGIVGALIAADMPPDHSARDCFGFRYERTALWTRTARRPTASRAEERLSDAG